MNSKENYRKALDVAYGAVTDQVGCSHELLVRQHSPFIEEDVLRAIRDGLPLEEITTELYLGRFIRILEAERRENNSLGFFELSKAIDRVFKQILFSILNV